jgi:hypothetical protein
VGFLINIISYYIIFFRAFSFFRKISKYDILSFHQ